MSYIYLAQPYSSEDPTIMQQRFETAEKVTADLLKLGFHIYSPIVHCHELAIKHNLPKEFDFWQKYNFAILESSLFMAVLQLPGWTESKGLAAEMQFADENHIPIVFGTSYTQLAALFNLEPALES